MDRQNHKTFIADDKSKQNSIITRRSFLQVLGGTAAMAMTSRLLANQEKAQKLPNILLITSEDNGPQLGCYGDPYADTPNLDAMAAEGIRFNNAFITYSVCSPSRSSIYTGLYPHQNGQIGLATHNYSMFEYFPNIISLLKEKGYATGVIGKIHVNPEDAFPCDFRAFPGSNFKKRDMKKFAAAAEKFISGEDKPFFLMVNFPDAHAPFLKQDSGLPAKPLEAKDVDVLPWVGVDTPRIREYTANYYNCLSRLDSGIGFLMDVLTKTGNNENTLIIYLGDHGPQFSRGKGTLYESGIRVPFIMKWQGRIKPKQVKNELVSSIDILPTVLEAISSESISNLPGRSLLSLCREEKVVWRKYIFAEDEGATPGRTFPVRSIRDDRYKLIMNLRQDQSNPIHLAYLTVESHFSAGVREFELADAPEYIKKAYETWRVSPPIELYDLKDDPYEWVNLADAPQYKDIKQRLIKALDNWREETHDPSSNPQKLNMLITEMDATIEKEIDYKSDGFRWKYLDYYRINNQ